MMLFTPAKRISMHSIFLGKDESIVIDTDIIVTVLEVRGDEVEFRIERPSDVSVEQAEERVAVHQAADELAASL